MNSIQIMTITVLVAVTLVVWWIDNISEEFRASNVKGNRTAGTENVRL